MTIFAWDELGNEITIQTQAELDIINEEGGWELHKVHPNGVKEYRTDRHFALQVELDTNDPSEADILFTEVIEYAEMQEE